MYRLFLLLIIFFAVGFLTFGIAQESEMEPTNSLYESVISPDRSLTRRLEQADRLFELGRINEAAQLLGHILESADFSFLVPPKNADENTEKDDPSRRTLHQTINDDIIDRLRKLPKEARDSYAFQFEPTAKRLLENAVAAGSLDEIQMTARKYFLTTSGASAMLLVGIAQLERGDYAAAFLTLDRLKRLHTSIPDTLKPILDQALEEVQSHLPKAADQPPSSLPPHGISESAWLEQIGWRIPAGSPDQNSGTQAAAPLLEQNWTVPIFHRLTLERETEALSRQVRNGDDVYIPASQPLVVGDLFITRMLGETIAVDTNSGKRLWIASELEYRFPEGVNIPPRPMYAAYNSTTTLRLFFWHDRISQQLSSDGERIFSIDEHILHGHYLAAAAFGRGIPNLPGGGEDRRYDPGNTLTARDLKTGRILWQVGKFPYVQKYLDAFYASKPRNVPAGQVNIDEPLFTNDENALKETWFLGAPLPLQGKLYVIGETNGVFQLFVLESQTGRLIAQQPFAQSTASLSVNTVRRTYPLFPSASEGLVICPTGCGLVTALDATTLAPVWCYSYVPLSVPTPNQGNRNPIMPRFQQQMFMGGMGGDSNIEYTLKQFFSNSGWQVPSMMIDGRRVLVAPPDQGALYCLDLLSGKRLWDQTISRSNSLYVAGIHKDKVFLVTPVNVMTLDMNTGEDLTTSESRFPAALKPAGVGVRSGDQYFIPFTDGHLAVTDLNNGKLTWLDASEITGASPTTQETAADVIDSSERNRGHVSIFSPDGTANDGLQKPIQFGNLVGIKGRFFSQSPTQIAGFDQKKPLKQRAETLLNADANDPNGLLQQGRILKSEGKLTEAINAFRASLKAKPTVEAAVFLRQNLLEAIRKDYPSWSHACQELESLAEFPDEWGTILYAQIEGIIQSGQTDDLPAVLEKVFAFGQNQSVLIPASNDHSAQLHRALGCLMEQNLAKGSPELKARWEELAERFLDQFSRSASTEGLTLPALGTDQSFQWHRNPVSLPPEIQRWSMFVHIFRNTLARERAKLYLRKEYEQNRLPLALNLQEKPPTTAWSELPSLFDWKRTGERDMVVISDSATPAVANTLPNLPPVQGAVEKNEIDRYVANLVRITRNPSLLQNLSPIPFLGPSDSKLATFHYILKPETTGDFSFCCTDLSGQELWRLALPNTIVGYGDHPSYISGDHPSYVSCEYTMYIKGFQNFLLFVHGSSMIAMDTTPQSEKILWSKTVSSLLVSQQRSTRLDSTSQRLNPVSFPANSVFVSPHAVCCWETNCVYGLDPLTGQALWVRKVPYEHCTILGDEENLFLVFPDIQQVIAIDPASGWELASGPLPPGGMYIYGTNIVFMQRRLNDFTLSLCDLRDIHDKRRRALLVTDTAEGKLAPPLPQETLRDGVRDTSMLQVFQNDRFLSVATWDTKSLQIYDLQTKKRLLPDDNKLLEFVEGTVKVQAARCDVELVGDHFLVLFTKNMSIPPSRTPIQNEEGKSVNRSYQAIPGVSGIPIDEGVMMLFDSEGNPCWEKPTKIEKTYRLLDVPDRLPFMLFAILIAEKEANENRLETRIMGVDKRTGKERFRERIKGTNPYVPLQYFRIDVDSKAQTLTFTSQNRNPPRVVTLGFAEGVKAGE